MWCSFSFLVATLPAGPMCRSSVSASQSDITCPAERRKRARPTDGPAKRNSSSRPSFRTKLVAELPQTSPAPFLLPGAGWGKWLQWSRVSNLSTLATRPTHPNFRSSKSADRRFWSAQNSPIGRNRGFVIGNVLVGCGRLARQPRPARLGGSGWTGGWAETNAAVATCCSPIVDSPLTEHIKISGPLNLSADKLYVTQKRWWTDVETLNLPNLLSGYKTGSVLFFVCKCFGH